MSVLVVTQCIALLGSYVCAQFGDKSAALSIKVRDDLFVIYTDLVPGSTTVSSQGDGRDAKDDETERLHEAEDVLYSTGVQVPLVLKNLERLADVLELHQAAPTGGDEQGSRSQRVQAALYGDPPSATFVDEKDCRFGRFSRDQNCFGLAGRDITRLWSSTRAAIGTPRVTIQGRSWMSEPGRVSPGFAISPRTAAGITMSLNRRGSRSRWPVLDSAMSGPVSTTSLMQGCRLPAYSSSGASRCPQPRLERLRARSRHLDP